jgi:hypothetical protein
MKRKTDSLLNSGSKLFWIVGGLCLFIACLSFKPSEPYLSEYLICNVNTAKESCQEYTTEGKCQSDLPCIWNTNSCGLQPCSNVSIASCGNDDFYYCMKHDNTCKDTICYENFSENQVNNEIYPWSTYAYLPFLLFLGPFAEIISYRFAILVGILGRVVTRALLLYGKTLLDMQIMQVKLIV